MIHVCCRYRYRYKGVGLDLQLCSSTLNYLADICTEDS